MQGGSPVVGPTSRRGREQHSPKIDAAVYIILPFVLRSTSSIKKNIRSESTRACSPPQQECVCGVDRLLQQQICRACGPPRQEFVSGVERLLRINFRTRPRGHSQGRGASSSISLMGLRKSSSTSLTGLRKSSSISLTGLRTISSISLTVLQKSSSISRTCLRQSSCIGLTDHGWVLLHS